MQIKLFTSFYDNFFKIPSDYICVGISRVIPENFRTNDIDNFIYAPENVLAPSLQIEDLFNKKSIDKTEFIRRYVKELKKNLEQLGCHSFNEYFLKMVTHFSTSYQNWEALVFLCNEHPGEFCHRHILSKLMDFYGYHVEELDLNKKNLHKDKIIQSALF